MSKTKQQQESSQEEELELKIVEKKHSDLKLGFAFMLEDCDGKQIQISDTLTFKCALEPGMINSIIKRIDNTLSALGQDYFMQLLREYISKKQKEIYNNDVLEVRGLQDDNKTLVSEGVNEIIGDFKEPSNIESDNSDVLSIE